ncbi:MAG: hypothetical protein WC455_30965 [Dehalococcoidia bacterium]|jgi:hypothetical protein
MICPECGSTWIKEEWGDDGHGNCGFVWTCCFCYAVYTEEAKDESKEDGA